MNIESINRMNRASLIAALVEKERVIAAFEQMKEREGKMREIMASARDKIEKARKTEMEYGAAIELIYDAEAELHNCLLLLSREASEQ